MNTFVIVGDQPVEIIWNNVTLSQDEFSTLEKILQTLHYFGRAESRCTAILSTNASRNSNCTKFDSDEPHNTDSSLVQVLVPKSNVEFVDLSTQNNNKKPTT